MSEITYEVDIQDVCRAPADLLLLKHAQDFYGADREVARKLCVAGLYHMKDFKVPPGEAVVLPTRGIIAPDRVMILGTPELFEFGYAEMREFARRALLEIARLHPPVNVVTTTVHGEGYGLDPGESLDSLVQGFEHAAGELLSCPVRSIRFLTLSTRTARILHLRLGEITEAVRTESEVAPPLGTFGFLLREQPSRRESGKKSVFVAMPFSEDFENVYEFGIYPAVTGCGFACEKVDEVHFTGDILEHIRKGIERASLVIADLSGARPNVYLEVGYAWGLGKQVVVLARKGEELHFDVKTHRCIYYGKFTRLRQDLENLLKGLQASGQI